MTITSAEEQTFVAALVGNGDRWIGLHRQNNDAWGEWVTAEAYSYTHWDNGEPNENWTACARIKQDGTWADRGCNNSYGAICERE